MIPNNFKSSKQNNEKPASGVPQSGTKTKNSILRLKLAG
jgi:hypothetical protein